MNLAKLNFPSIFADACNCLSLPRHLELLDQICTRSLFSLKSFLEIHYLLIRHLWQVTPCPGNYTQAGGAAQRIPLPCERQSRGKCMCFLHIIVTMELRAGMGESGEPWTPASETVEGPPVESRGAR